MSTIARLPGFRPDSRVVVLLYHSISDTTAHASASLEMFRLHLEWLKAHCEVVPFDQILDHNAMTNHEKPVVAITFDDGYTDNYFNAFPLLAEYGLPATFFVSTGLIDGWHPVTERFMRLQNAPEEDVTGLTWSQVEEMHSAGMAFGAHTVSHLNLGESEDAVVRGELTESKEKLEEHCGVPITMFAYPFGKPKHHYTSRTTALVREAGFQIAAIANDRGLRQTDGQLEIPRISVTGDDLETVEAKVQGRFDALGIWQERAPRWLSHAVSPDNSHRTEYSIRKSGL